MNHWYIGIDNGVTGTIGIMNSDKSVIRFICTPVKKEQNYIKARSMVTRLDAIAFAELIKSVPSSEGITIAMERPMINPTRFQASLSAIRCLESMITVLESLSIGFIYIDSKQWQKEMLPSGLKGAEEQKAASLDIGCRLFPQFREAIVKHKDADGLLMAEYARRKVL